MRGLDTKTNSFVVDLSLIEFRCSANGESLPSSLDTTRVRSIFRPQFSRLIFLSNVETDFLNLFPAKVGEFAELRVEAAPPSRPEGIVKRSVCLFLLLFERRELIPRLQGKAALRAVGIGGANKVSTSLREEVNYSIVSTSRLLPNLLPSQRNLFLFNSPFVLVSLFPLAAHTWILAMAYFLPVSSPRSTSREFVRTMKCQLKIQTKIQKCLCNYLLLRLVVYVKVHSSRGVIQLPPTSTKRKHYH